MIINSFLDKIRLAGVVGAGGAGFPTHIKVSNQVHYILANGAECEPLLQVDQQLMTFYPEKIISGLKYLMQMTQARLGIIVLKKKYRSAIGNLKKCIQPSDNIKIKSLNSFYPAGDEHQLVYQVTKRTVPENGIPLQLNIIVNNIGTLFHIHDAINDIPVTEKYLTVTGEVEYPRTFLTAIGTPIKDLLNISRVKIRDYAVINGGPMMGKMADVENDVVMKTTSGIIVLPSRHYLVRKKAENINRSIKLSKTLCIQCHTCTENCPRNCLGHNLKPHLLMKKIALGLNQINENFSDAFLCCECGVCGYYSCPMDLLPVKVIQKIKSILMEKGIKPSGLNNNPKPDKLYEKRLIPTDKVISRLDLLKYVRLHAPMMKKKYEPDTVRIPLKQHIGIPAMPVVSEGQNIIKGDLIADIPVDKTGSRIHASLSGKITHITENFIEIKK
ncbi:MAG: 4Fe-4S dicluster domain-containing protein [bacterium]|nr:4Fe-4S dicluster domain-containing protein [bacterium]